MCYHHRRECIVVPKADARFQAAGNSQEQRARPLFFPGAMRLGSRISAEQMRSMADILMEKQQKQRGRGRGRPFEKGRSGNPAGWPRGTGKRATQAMQLLLDG
jgi:hypothetical protein